MTINEVLEKDSALTGAPQIACKLNKLLKTSFDTEEVVEVVRYDPGLTSRILQVCNSPAYRPRNGISSLHEAVNHLGSASINRLVWQVSMAGSMQKSLASYKMEAGMLWRHSLTTAIAAEEMSKLSGKDENRDAAFTAGLLHDIGKVLTNVALSPYVPSFNDYVLEDGLPPHHAESALLGFNHAEVGGRLLQKWGQDSSLVLAVVHHHSPDMAASNRLATLVSAANRIAYLYEDILQKNAIDLRAPELAACLNQLEIDGSKLDSLVQVIQKRRAEVEVFMAIM